MLRFQLAAAVVVALIVSPLAGSASATSYHSPGYKGTGGFATAVTTPLPPISLGTGKYPNLLVDEAGTAHIVFAQDGGLSAPDTLFYCNLQRGIKNCASAGNAPNPQAPEPSDGSEFSGNFPGGNHDFEGPIPLAIGNQLFVIDRRFPDFFKTPGGSKPSDSNVFEWSSVDGGATITGPGQIGDNQTAGGAIAYGDPNAPSVGTISASETGGTFFQGSSAGQYTTDKAKLGEGDQAYDGKLALDGTEPVAAFADLSGNVFVREWSGQGSVNDASTWSNTSFPGFQPQIVGGAGGVYVLYSDSPINGGNLQLRRITGGQPVGAPTPLGTSSSLPAISEDPSGRIALAYTDQLGVEVRTSTDGVEFSPPALAVAIPSGATIGHLEVAAAADGGGFTAYVQDPAGAEGVGTVNVAAFGTQQTTGNPGLGPLPGGGIGSSVGDELATSTCNTAGFGVLVAENAAGACWGHVASNPNLDVSSGEVDINGLRIVPDAGAHIGIDPKLHTIDTIGNVRVVLSGPGVNITLFHGELHAKIPVGEAGDDLFDLREKQPPLVEGFPIHGDVDIKLVKGGVQVPISLTLPEVFGTVTGSVTLEASTPASLKLSSLDFKVSDADFGAAELKDVDVSYALQGEVWKGMAKLEVPAGGAALNASVSVEFDKGQFTSGSLDVGLPYPGIPLDDVDTPPQIYLSHGGLGLGLNPLTLSGTIGFGVTPLVLPPEVGGEHDYAFSLDGKLSAAFGKPVTLTLTAEGFLYKVKLSTATLVYKIPNQVSLTGSAELDLGLIRFKGQLGAIVDAEHNVFGGHIKTDVFLKLPDPVGEVRIPSLEIAFNNSGFADYIPFPGIPAPAPPFFFYGTIYYRWGDPTPQIDPTKNITGRFTAGIPVAGGSRAHAHAAAAGFTVPAHAPTASVIAHGSGGAPSVVLIAPGGQRIVPDGKVGSGHYSLAVPDPSTNTTHVGIQNPPPGSWGVEQAPGSQIPIESIEFAIGERAPTVRAKLSGHGLRHTLRYHAAVPANVTVSFAEQTSGSSRVIGRAKGASGTINFRPGPGPPGRRQVVAQISNEGLPVSTKPLGSFVVPRPPRPSRAKRLHVSAGRAAFSFSFVPPANAAHTLLQIVASDGRHLQQILPPGTRHGTVTAIGFGDGVSVTVIGLAADGSRGPAVKASAKQALPGASHSRRPRHRRKAAHHRH